ncbi:MAG: beta-glucosidase BglX [Clostridiaceae bacterium]|nr:beta-glucosidase BglX [Clostridiaceae bacterium]
MTEKELRALLEDMSLREKIGQLTQLDASVFNDEGPVTGPASELGLNDDDAYLCGSVLGLTGAAETEALQKMCMAKQPHGIPLLLMADIINGYKTIFPIPLAQGCSFEPEAARKVAEIMAKESAAAGLHVTFAPMVDLVRDARWGRVMESTGEDPYLNSLMAAAMVEGIQGQENSYEDRLAACTKHFAAYGAPIAGKEYNNVELSERSLREDHLPSYKAAIDAGTAMMMTSFNTLDRVPATASKWLMRKILREEMGFNGVLISDWNAIGELIGHGVAQDPKSAAELAITAGVDMDMMSFSYACGLEKLVEEGTVSEQLIDESVWRLLQLKNQMGLFENPFRSASTQQESELILSAEHRLAAREVAAKTFVLLKNEDQLLPLEQDDSVAYIGPYIEEKSILGAWSFFGKTEDCVSIREAVEARGVQAEYAHGCGVLNPGQAIYGFRYDTESNLTEAETEKMIADAVALAANKTKVVIALGESNLQTGEGGSRGDITIPDIQKKLLEAIYAVNKNIVAVIFAGRPLDIRDIKDKTKSILYAWMPGTEGGSAIVDMLYGDTAPQGKLSMSLPYSVGQVPVFYSELRTGRHTEDGAEPTNRFLTKYCDIPNDPLYPFGFGLSYTDFSISPVRLSSDQLTLDTTVKAVATVKNIGNREGVETIQLYIRDEFASVARPLRELKGIKQVKLEPGQEAEVEFEIDTNMLRFYDINMEYKAQHGDFTVWIGNNSKTDNSVCFTLN